MSIERASRRRRLPDLLPIFPLPSALLLPGCRLPLNVFEPRYLQMVDDALEGDRMIGMIQPSTATDDGREPRIQTIGCAGRIASFRESDDGRYKISLVGISRFEVVQEVPSDRLYRLVEPSWRRFRLDRAVASQKARIDREELVANLRAYFNTHGLEANWNAIEQSGNEELVNSLAMVCPFDAAEKQALLEAMDLQERSRLVIALMNMAVLHQESKTVH